MKKNNKGFTLVELIVVLVILAILAAIMIPALLGYIDRAKEQKFVLMAESVERAVMATYSETYGAGYEIVQLRSNYHEGKNGSHYGEVLYCYKAGATNNAVLNKDGTLKSRIVEQIFKLSDLGDDYQLGYISFAFNHDLHQICDNKDRPGVKRVAGQGADTEIILYNKKNTSQKVKLSYDDNTHGWYIVK